MTAQASASTRWVRVEFEDSRFDVALRAGAIKTIVRKRLIGGEVMQLTQRSDGPKWSHDTGFWDRNVWISLGWVWRQIWHEGL